MNELVEKLIQAEREMSSEKGRFLLFALFLREDAPDVWDLVVAAPWVTKNEAYCLRYISKKLGSILNKKELMKLSRVVLIDENNPGLASLQRTIGVEHGKSEIKDSIFFGLQIRHAYVITSRKEKDSALNGKAVRAR